MYNCNCIGRLHPACCHNRWFNHYDRSHDPHWTLCPGCHKLKPSFNGEVLSQCICKEIQNDKEKQRHDLIWDLEKRMTLVEKDILTIKNTLDLIWESFRVMDNLKNEQD